MNKILFVTSDRHAAQLGAQALQSMAPGSRFTWTQTPESALRWLQANRDAAAVVVEAATQSAGVSFKDRVRALGTGIRVVVVAPGGMGTVGVRSGAGAPPVAGPRTAERPAPEGRRSERLTVALQERLLDLEKALDESRRAQKIERLAAADRLAQHEAESAAALARAGAARAAIEQKLADSIVRAAQARQRAEADSKAAAFREGALRNQLADAAAVRKTLEQNLAASEAAQADAERRQATRVADALARLNDLQTRYDAVLAIHATARVNLEQQLAEAEAARQQLAAEAADAVARETVLKDRLADEAMGRERLERTLRDAEAARADAERRHDAELAESAARLTDFEKAYDDAHAEHAAARAALAQRLSEEIASRERVEHALATAEAVQSALGQQLSAAAAATQQLESEAAAAAARQAALSEQLAVETAAREATEQKLAGAEAARADEERRHAKEFVDAAARLDDLRRTYETALRERDAARTAFEQQLRDADAARQQLESEAAAAAARETALSEQLAAETAARDATEQKLAAAEDARAEAERRHAAELARAAAHLADLERAYDHAVAEHTAARTSFEHQLSEAAAVRDDLVSQASVAAEREAALVDQLARETAAREAIEQELSAAEAARANTDRQHAIELAEAAARLVDLQSAYESAQAAHAAARAALEQELADAAADAEAAALVRSDLESELVESRSHAAAARRRLLDLALRRRRRTRELLAELAAQLDDERLGAERALAVKDEALRESEADRARLRGDYDQARKSLDHLGISFAALERVAAENAAERARLESVAAERDAQLRMQVERHLAAERTASDAIEALRRELQTTAARAMSLQRDAERTAVLQAQLEETLKESRRLFERAPYGLCRFMPDGAFIKANHSFARLLGYRKADDVRSVSLGTVFECAADLRWVVERAAATAATATIETALKTRDGRRLEARLHALRHADGTVDLAVQDLTSVRALEARLSEAHRMEAVGRLASEVAVTCDMVLRDVTDGGRAWLAGIDNHPELRQRGELLLGEVTRAAGFLRDFSVYGRKQISALERVSVQQMIRNLAPVLKRVAGHDIEWVLPKVSRPVYVDVDSERVERLLVNVASYARQRIPHSGQVRIDVATTVLGRDFIAKYPNVRPGAHALITIAEVKRGDRAQGWPDAGSVLDTHGAMAAAAVRTGVDLGALLALLGDCGGHLWIAAEQSGNMTLKVHLPQRISSDVGVPTRAATPSRTQRVRQLAGWFRH